MDCFYWIGVAAVVVLALIGCAHVVFIGIQFYTSTFINHNRLLDYYAAWKREQKNNDRNR